VNPADLIGTVVRNEITAGQPITHGSLIKPGERGFLAAALGPGMRAVTVSVSSTSGVAGFVFPGDRVDIVLTQAVSGGGEGPPLKVSETVIQNARVLATDQRMSAQGEDGKAVVQNFSTVTLEATPKIAEKIAVASTIGQLSLSLRSIADNSAELERAIASGEVSVPEGTDPKAEKQMLLAIANKPIDTRPTYTIGSTYARFSAAAYPQKTVRSRLPETRWRAAIPHSPAHQAARTDKPAPPHLKHPGVRRFASPGAIRVHTVIRRRPSKMTKRTNIPCRPGTATPRSSRPASAPVRRPPAFRPAAAGPPTSRPVRSCLCGEGKWSPAPGRCPNVWTSNPGVADVNVTSPRPDRPVRKEAGEATIIATAADGSVVYGAKVRVSQNISSIDAMLRAALPESSITVTHSRTDCPSSTAPCRRRRQRAGRAAGSSDAQPRNGHFVRHCGTEDRPGEPPQGSLRRFR
jgi:Flp pilus assembly protein CpaB